MQELQLYIEDTRVDLFKDESVSITQTIQNVKDPAKVFTSFTKTFSVPASKTNNLLFKHYYNFNIVGGFDASIKKTGRIELNLIPYKTGRIKLEGVDLKDNMPHTYRITFFGNTVELPDILGDDKLGSLTFGGNAFNLVYSDTAIRSYLSNEINGGKIIVPLITHTQRLFYNSGITGNNDNLYYNGSAQGVEFDQLKYAIRLYEIILEIETKYTIANGYANNIVFSRDFFSTSNPVFYNLYMWLHRKSGSVQAPTQTTTYTTVAGNWSQPSGAVMLSFGTSILVPAYLVTTQSTVMQNTITLTPASGNAVSYYVEVRNQGFTVATTQPTTGVTTIQDLNGVSIAANGVYTVVIIHENSMTFSSCTWNFQGFYRQPPDPTPYTYNDTFSISNLTAAADFQFSVSEQIPEVTIMSFLTGLFKMFNLVAYVNNEGTIVVRPLEAGSQVDYAYYTNADVDGNDAPVNYNISNYVDTKVSSVNVALPYKEINYKYEGTGTIFAKQHEQLSGTAWGSLSYIGGESTTGTGGINYNASTKIYNVSVPFEHMKFERLIDPSNSNNYTDIQWGWSVNENQQPYIGKPLIFYAERITLGTILSFQKISTTSNTRNYWVPSNSLSLTFGGRENINFNQEQNEYTPFVTFNQTLFADYHSPYMIDVFNTSRRITKITAFLPLKILFNFKLNDIFTINTTDYIINSVTTNLQSGKSSMELLNKVRETYSILRGITFQGTGGGSLYYRSSLGGASSIGIGDRIYTNEELTGIPTNDVYYQTGDATEYTHCGVGSTMSMGLASGGVVSITCT